MNSRTIYHPLLLACFLSMLGPSLLLPVPPYEGDEIRIIVYESANESYQLGTKYIVPGSIEIQTENGTLLREGHEYVIDHAAGIVVINANLPEGSNVVVTYRSYPFHLPQIYSIADKIIQKPTRKTGAPQLGYPEVNRIQQKEKRNVVRPPTGFSIDGTKSISISTNSGTGFSMSQSLDLEVKGKITRDMDLGLRLSDRNVPLQSQSVSQSLRQIDNVSISIRDKHGGATVGDYQHEIDGFRFLRFERRLEGFEGRWNFGNLKVAGVGAVSKGEYVSNFIIPKETVQGPYILRAKNGSRAYNIFPRSEHVYLDGKMLKRGKMEDYTIDNNEGTLTFTEKILLHNNSSIEVDFEHSSSGYRKSIYSTVGETTFNDGKFQLKGYFIGEKDLQSGELETDSLSDVSGNDIGNPKKSDRVGFSGVYDVSEHLKIESEIAIFDQMEIGDSQATSENSKAFSIKSSLNDKVIHFNEMPVGSLSLALSGELVGDGFSFEQRRNEPGFERNWNLKENDRNIGESRQEFSSSVTLLDDIGVDLDFGRINRNNGESSFRRKVRGEISFSSLPKVTYEIIRVNSANLLGESLAEINHADSIGFGSLSRDRIEINKKLGKWVPIIGFEREERDGNFSNGRLVTGSRNRELYEIMSGNITNNLSTRLKLSQRSSQVVGTGNGEWTLPYQNLSEELSLNYSRDAKFLFTANLAHQSYKRSNIGSEATRSSSLVGRIDLFSSALDRDLQSNFSYRITSSSQSASSILFVPERNEFEGEYLEDGTYVGKELGSHQKIITTDDDDYSVTSRVSVSSKEVLNLSHWIKPESIPLKNLSWESTINITTETDGENGKNSAFFLPGLGLDGKDILFGSVKILQDVCANWKEGKIVTRFAYEKDTSLDRRFTNFFANSNSDQARIQLKAPLSDNTDADVTFSLRNEDREGFYSDGFSSNSKSIETELMHRRPSSQRRYFLRLNYSSIIERERGIALRDIEINPGMVFLFGGNGRLGAEYKFREIANLTPALSPSISLLRGGGVGMSNIVELNANWKLLDSFLLSIIYRGSKTPMQKAIVNYGRSELQYSF